MADTATDAANTSDGTASDGASDAAASESASAARYAVSTVVLAADHAGFELKQVLAKHLQSVGCEVLDRGTHSTDSVDYPEFGADAAREVAERVTGHGDAPNGGALNNGASNGDAPNDDASNGDAPNDDASNGDAPNDDASNSGAPNSDAPNDGAFTVGVLVCGSGVGMAIAANKVPGIRAVAASDVPTARLSRQHNNANVLCLGARLTSEPAAIEILDAFLANEFEGGRHQRRVGQLDALIGEKTLTGEKTEKTPSGAQTGTQASPGSPWAKLWNTAPDTVTNQAIADELERQCTTVQLIASENFASPAVMAATGSVFTNKYSEGYAGRRYYGGNINVDVVEQLAIDRAKELFGAEHANVQSHSGSNANAAVYQALLSQGDTVMGMSLDHGGHLTHGSPVNFSGKTYNFVSYGLTASDERIDYDEMSRLAREHKPRLIVAGATAYSRAIDPKPFREVCDEIGALFMFDAAHIAGLIVGGAHENPTPLADIVTLTTHKTLRGPRGGAILCKSEYAKKIDSAVFPGTQGGPLDHVVAAKAVAFREAADPSFADYAHRIVANAKALADALGERGFRLVSGGTDNHLLLVDLRSFDADLTGKKAQEVLDEGGVTLNRNTIPDDPRSPFVTSGLRMGTASVTTQGMGVDEMPLIADFTARILTDREDPAAVAKVRTEIAQLCAQFPPY